MKSESQRKVKVEKTQTPTAANPPSQKSQLQPGGDLSGRERTSEIGQSSERRRSPRLTIVRPDGTKEEQRRFSTSLRRERSLTGSAPRSRSRSGSGNRSFSRDDHRDSDSYRDRRRGSNTSDRHHSRHRRTSVFDTPIRRPSYLRRYRRSYCDNSLSGRSERDRNVTKICCLTVTTTVCLVIIIAAAIMIGLHFVYDIFGITQTTASTSRKTSAATSSVSGQLITSAVVDSSQSTSNSQPAVTSGQKSTSSSTAQESTNDDPVVVLNVTHFPKSTDGRSSSTTAKRQTSIPITAVTQRPAFKTDDQISRKPEAVNRKSTTTSSVAGTSNKANIFVRRL